MYDKQQHSFCAEFYTVEKSIEVVVNIAGNDERIRIDALRQEPSGRYSTKSYIEESLTLQPTYPQTGGKYDKQPQNFRIWVSYDLPWTDGGTADEALRRALGFLKDRCK